MIRIISQMISCGFIHNFLEKGHMISQVFNPLIAGFPTRGGTEEVDCSTIIVKKNVYSDVHK